MSEPPSVADLTLEMLRQMRDRNHKADLELLDLKMRASAQEDHMAGIVTTLAGISHRLDRIDERLGRIERRLDLVDARS
jgi:uncharacterized coiled-coil protein SlyX